MSRGSGYALLFGRTDVTLALGDAGRDAIRMRLVGAPGGAAARGVDRRSGVVNYLIGNDPAQWRTGIPTYSRVRYAGIYPGVDLVFYGNQRELEYDFVVAPGADPSRIAWQVDGARAQVDRAGDLRLETAGGAAVFRKPVVYQITGRGRTAVAGSFAVAGDRVAFALGSYDHSRELVIDPVLSYATYLAGAANDTIGRATGPGNLQVGVSQGLAVDGAGSVYVTGGTYSLDFPVKQAYQGPPSGKPAAWATAFVSKFSPDGSSLVYSTYLGGSSSDYAYAIAVDASGAAYVTGQTSSNNFPVSGSAYQSTCSPAPANHGPPYTASCNTSNTSAFVAKLNPAGNGVAYSTFLGGYGFAYATAIAVDSAGRAYVAGNETQYCSAGFTFQGCFPTTNGAVIGGDRTGGGSPQYAFVSVFDAAGAQLLYSSLFGDLNSATKTGSGGGSYATGIAVDRTGAFYLIGDTQAGRLPTTSGVLQTGSAPLDPSGNLLQAWRGFVAKFTPVAASGGASLAWATYLGGRTASLSDFLSGIAIDGAGDIYLAGYTNSRDFPVSAGALQTTCGPGGATCSAAHVTKLNGAGTAMLWSTYIGGSKTDGSDAFTFTGPLQLDASGGLWLIGQAGPTYPLIDAVQPAVNSGSLQVVLVQLDAAGAALKFATRLGSGGKNTSTPAGLALDAAGNVYVAGNNLGPDLLTTSGAFQTSAGSSTCCYHGFVAKIAPGPGKPAIASVVNGASFQPGIVAGSWVTIRGSNLAANPAGRIWRADEVVNGQLPTLLDGVGVTINGKPAFVYYVSPTQLNVQAPSDSASGAVPVVVTNNGQRSDPVTVPLQTYAPAFFQYTGSKYAIVTRNGDNALIADPAAIPGTVGARPGDVLILWGTGFGPTNPDAPAGRVVTGAPLAVTAPVIQIDGAPVTVYGTALSPGSVGLYQVAIQLPAAIAPGEHALTASVGGAQSPAGVSLFVAR